MFNSNDIKAYHGIKAPPELHDSILESLEASKVPRRFITQSRIRQLSALAACFVAVLGIISFTMLTRADITLSYQQSEIADTPTPITVPAAMPVAMRARSTGISIPLTLELDRAATVEITNGSLSTVESGELIQSLELDSDTELLVFPDYGTEHCELTVRSLFTREVYTITLDENSSGYLIEKSN